MLEQESVCKINLDTEPRSKKGTMVHQALRQTPCQLTCSRVWPPCPVICAYHLRAGRYSKLNRKGVSL